jgi:hypothetical protein
MPILFVFVFPIFWCLVLYVISIIGGWRQLARRFRQSIPVVGTTWRFQSAGIHQYLESSYGSCLNVTANEDGIGLSVLILLRFGHPPLFMPWSEILVSQVRRLLFLKRVRLTFPEEPSVWIEINARLATKIQVALGQQWFTEIDRENSFDQ